MLGSISRASVHAGRGATAHEKAMATVHGQSSIVVLRTRSILRIVAALVLALIVVSQSLSTALAHAIIVRSEPPDGGAVMTAPHEVRLWFSEAISPQFTQAQVLNMKGEAVAGTQVTTATADPTLLIITVPQLSDGVYNVVYAALSAADGHSTQGHLVFKVGAAATEGTAALTASQSSVSVVEVVLRWLNFAALAGLVGAIAVAFLLLKPPARADSNAADVAGTLAKARRRVLRWAVWCAMIGVAISVAQLYWQATVLTLPPGGGEAAATPTLQAVSRLLGGTRWGALWLARQVVLLAMAIPLYGLRHRTNPDRPDEQHGMSGILLGLLSVVLLATQALSGHAAGVSPDTSLAVIMDTLHLMAASLWVGGLLALGVGLLPLVMAGRNTSSFDALFHAGWGPFGQMAALSVGTLIATGLYNTGRQVASIDALITTLYGRTLIVKVALVLGVGAFGLLNSSLLHPRVAAPLAKLLRRPSGWTPLSLKRLPALVITESIGGLLVLVATGTLISSPPAHGPEFAPPPPAASVDVLSQMADDLMVIFQAQPNQPGGNILLMRVVSMRRPAPAEIMRVIVHFTYLGQNVGTVTADAQEISPDLYQLAGEQLSLTGPWQVDVVVRRKGIEDSTASFKWTVAPVSISRPVVVSNRPIGGVLTWAGALLLAGVMLAAAGLAWLKHAQSHPGAPSRRVRSSSQAKTRET